MNNKPERNRPPVAANFESLGVSPQRNSQQVDPPPVSGNPPSVPLPPLHQAVLHRRQLDQLFQDIGDCANAVQVFAGRKAETGVDSHEQLQQARRSLLTGEVARLQIRYTWQDQLWIDTLQPVNQQFRLLRIAHPTAS